MSLTAEQVTQFDKIVADLVAGWNAVKPVAGKHWYSISVTGMEPAFKLIVDGVEQLVNLAEGMTGVSGADKKAVVLACANKLFMLVVAAELPLALQPFSSTLQSIFDSLLSSLIEKFVSKLPTVDPATPKA